MADSRTMVCSGHGGRAAVTHAGSANGMYIDGRSMKYPGPELFNQDVLAKLADPKLLDQSEEISVFTVLAAEEVKNLGLGVDPGSFLPQLDRLVNAMQTSNGDEIRGALNTLLELARAGSGRVVIANRIKNLFESRRKLVESQRQHVIALGLWMDRGAALRNADALMRALTRHVRDPQTLRAVVEDLREIIGDGNGASADDTDGTVH